ncbi:MAG: hypothetical protein JOZ07_13995 [Solirubrobacterales bacterium]|nr:hypothetical protein [Solirubrobacterales bacterium]
MQLITYDNGIDTDEEWDQSWEGKDHGCDMSIIHLSTTRDGFSPALHLHPYPEVILIRRGTATVYVGDQELEGIAGQTVIVPSRPRVRGNAGRRML